MSFPNPSNLPHLRARRASRRQAAGAAAVPPPRGTASTTFAPGDEPARRDPHHRPLAPLASGSGLVPHVRARWEAEQRVRSAADADPDFVLKGAAANAFRVIAGSIDDQEWLRWAQWRMAVSSDIDEHRALRRIYGGNVNLRVANGAAIAGDAMGAGLPRALRSDTNAAEVQRAELSLDRARWAYLVQSTRYLLQRDPDRQPGHDPVLGAAPPEGSAHRAAWSDAAAAFDFVQRCEQTLAARGFHVERVTSPPSGGLRKEVDVELEPLRSIAGSGRSQRPGPGHRTGSALRI